VTLDYGYTRGAQSYVLAAAGLLIERIPIGLYFAIAGCNKIAGGVGGFVAKASGMIPPWLPTPLGRAYLYALPWMEVLTGVLMILGLFGRATAIVMSLILISISIAVTGIFGKGGGPFDPNLILLGLTIGLALTGPGPWSLDSVLFGRRRR
jgi:putative oxidoreductase